jgi:hypothetical protein
MSYAITYSRAYVGVEAPLVSVETHLSGSLPALTVVGINNPILLLKHKNTVTVLIPHDEQIQKLIHSIQLRWASSHD